MLLSQIPKHIIQRFFDNLIVTESCWYLKDGRTKDRYSIIYPYGRKGGQLGAHRLSYIIANGCIEDTKYACHTCDNKPCVRFDHIFEGTKRENVYDALSKGIINTRGEKNGQAVLTEIEVRRIRELIAEGKSQTSIADLYEVHPSTIHLIYKGKKWGWLK